MWLFYFFQRHPSVLIIISQIRTISFHLRSYLVLILLETSVVVEFCADEAHSFVLCMFDHILTSVLIQICKTKSSAHSLHCYMWLLLFWLLVFYQTWCFTKCDVRAKGIVRSCLKNITGPTWYSITSGLFRYTFTIWLNTNICAQYCCWYHEVSIK